MLSGRPNRCQRETTENQLIIGNLPMISNMMEIAQLIETVTPYESLKKYSKDGKNWVLVTFSCPESVRKCEKAFRSRIFRGNELTIEFVHHSLEKFIKVVDSSQQKKEASLQEQIIGLKDKEKTVLLGLLSKLSVQKNMFSQFMTSHQGILKALIKDSTRKKSQL